MAIEFNLLYRWHGLIPSSCSIGGADEPICDTVFNPAIVVEHGLGAAVRGRVAPARRPGRPAQHRPGAAAGRAGEHPRGAAPSGSRRYNDYRELAKFPRVDRLRPDHRRRGACRTALRDLYGDVDRIEFFAGLFAEDARPNSVLPSLIGRMVGVDAFSQALTNPLLAPRVFNEQTFSPLGMEIIGSTRPLVGHPAPQRPGEPGGHFVPDPRGLGAGALAALKG